MSAAAVITVKATGSDNNGGGFAAVYGGADRTDNPLTLTGVTVSTPGGDTEMSASNYTFQSSDVGNVVQFNGERFVITSVSAGEAIFENQQWSIDPSGTAYLGGALASPGELGKMIAQGLDPWISSALVHIKAGTYSITLNSANVSGGKISVTAAFPVAIQGYQTTPGDQPGYGSQPVFSADVTASMNLIHLASSGTARHSLECVTCNGNSRAGVRGINVASVYPRVHRCFAVNCPSYGMYAAGPLNCGAINCGQYGIYSPNGPVSGCVVIGGGSTAGISGVGRITDCLVHGCSGIGIVTASPYNSEGVARCTVDGCTGNGIDLAYGGSVEDTIITKNVGYGVDCTYNAGLVLRNVFFWSNTAGRCSGTPLIADYIDLTDDPYLDRDNDDFAPNNVSGGGALLRAAAHQLYGQTAGRDVGAVQSVAIAAASRVNLMRRLQSLAGVPILNG